MRFVALTVPAQDPKEGTERIYVNADHVVYVEPGVDVRLKALYDTPGKPVRGPRVVYSATVILVDAKYLTVVHDDAPYTDATSIEVVESVIAKLQGEGE